MRYPVFKKKRFCLICVWGMIFYRKNVSNTCFFRKSHSTASWVILVIQQQHFEEKFVLNPIFSESLIPEQPFDFFFFSDSIFFSVSTLEQHLIGPKKVNSRAAQNCSKSGPMVIFQRYLRRFLVTSFPDKLRFCHSTAAFN